MSDQLLLPIVVPAVDDGKRVVLYTAAGKPLVQPVGFRVRS